MRLASVLALCGLLAASCGDRGSTPARGAPAASGTSGAGAGGSGSSAGSGSPAPAAEAATPVHAGQVRRATLAARVQGPGSTVSVEIEVVRAPFAGTLVDLHVQDGDRIAAGQVLGHIVSRESAAALSGARAMRSSARTTQERADAERALTLARRGRVEKAVRAAAGGVVISHQGTAGALVAQDQDLVTIAPSGAVAFVARIDQSEVSRIRAGEPAAVDIPAIQDRLTARVHSLLPSAAAAQQPAPSASVRLDFDHAPRTVVPGLYGTARIVVAERRDALAVPAAAVLRNDITGVDRLATVTAHSTVHWVDVRTGLRDGDEVQLVAPPLPPGTRVVTEGQVGLPEGAPVQVLP